MALFGDIISGSAWRRNYTKVPIPNKEDWKRINARFGNNQFVTMVEKNLQAKHNIEFDYTNGGISVWTDRIVTKSKTYKYCDYNLSNLTLKDCWELAYYLGDGLPPGNRFTIRTLWSDRYSSGSTYYYETPGGHLAMGDTGSYNEYRDGFLVFLEGTEQKNKVIQKNW